MMHLNRIDEELQRFVGRSLSAPRVSRDPVNLPMIRHWCDAMGDTNPVYTDPDEAHASVHGDVVAPPAMAPVWTMPGLAPNPELAGGGQAELFEVLDGAGFTSVVATNADDKYYRYLRLGDQLTLSATFEGVSGLKHTSLGEGYFVGSHHRWHDQWGALVASSHIRVLKFAPMHESHVDDAGLSGASPNNEVRPCGQLGKGPCGIEIGDALGELVIDITPTLIISTAIASGDYQDVHHDRDLAQQRGSRDIFMNILTTQGILERYVTDWAGKNALIKRINTRLGAPNYPYDKMVVEGRVQAIMVRESGPIIEIETVGRNSIGNHVVATVTVQLEEAAP
jgi:hypothetical protein